jgi:hypothetical protein
MLNYRNIKNARQWKSSTGLSQERFHKLVTLFAKAYEICEGVSIDKGAANLAADLLLPTYGDCLFFVLFQLKNGLCYDNLGFLINTDGVNAQRNFERYLAILERALEQENHMPKRNFKNPEEFKIFLKDEKEIIFDASEQPTFRSKNNKAQKEYYSGKKSVTRTKS